MGEDHTDTLIAANNLASAYRAGGRVTEAIPLLERTLADAKRVQGDDHPKTLNFRNNLAGAYRDAGRVTEAESLETRAENGS